MIQHIALTLNDSKEIEDFYRKILHFALRQKFSVKVEIGRQIFNTEAATEVFVMDHDDVHLELFVTSEEERKVFSHICLAYRKAEINYKKAIEAGYRTFIKKNPGTDTYFIWDKSGNMFEIKSIV